MTLLCLYRRFSITLIVAMVTFIALIPQSASAGKDIKDKIRIPPEGISQIITLSDGSRIVGKIAEISSSEIKYQTDVGLMTIRIELIKGIKEIEPERMRKGKYWFPNPNATRMFFWPTGRMLQKNNGYFSDIYLFFPGVSYGLSKYVTVGGGMSLLPGVDLDEQIYYFTPKFGLYSSENANYAIGAMFISLPDIFDDEDDINNAGAFYGVGTWGSPDGNLTFGLGYGYESGDMENKPMFVIGGEKRLARRLSFVTENWILPGVDQPISLYGLRFFGEGLSVDLALAAPLGEDFFFPGIPYVDFVFNF